MNEIGEPGSEWSPVFFWVGRGLEWTAGDWAVWGEDAVGVGFILSTTHCQLESWQWHVIQGFSSAARPALS